MDLKEVGWDWIDFPQDKEQWQAHVRAVVNLRVPSRYIIIIIIIIIIITTSSLLLLLLLLLSIYVV